MKHHGMGHYRDRADRLFSYTIFIIRVDTNIANFLVMLKNLLNKKILFDETVIIKINIDHNAMIQTYFYCFLAQIVYELENLS